MSYIRCLSNPEGLYIFGSAQHVFICAGSEASRSMPVELWDKLLETWVDSYYDENIAVVMVIDGVKHEATLMERIEPGRSVFRITYQNTEGEAWELDGIWPVTLHYIADRFSNPYLGAGWFKRKLLEFLGVKP